MIKLQSKPHHHLLLALLITAGAYYFFGILTSSTWSQQHRYTHYYEQIGMAFLDGQTHLLIEPSKELLALENPYDRSLLRKAGISFRTDSTSKSYYWDATLYNDKYYLYWGAVPALLPWMAVKLLFDHSLSDKIITYFYATMGSFCLIFLLYLLHKKIAPINRSTLKHTLVWWIAILPICFGSAIPLLLKRPMVYEAAIAGAYGYIACGLLCLWLAYGENIRRPIIWKLLASLCFGLAVGCRSFHVLSVVILFTCWISLTPHKTFKAYWREGIILFLPWAMILVAIALYNYQRFDSPIEFGISYQLGVADQRNMVHHFSYERFIDNLDTYLLSRFDMRHLLPWDEALGRANTERDMLGLMTHSPFVLWIFMSLYFIKKFFKNNISILTIFINILCYALYCFVLILSFKFRWPRYSADFAPWFMMLASISYLYVTLQAREGWRQNTLIALGALLMLWTVYSGLVPFSCIQCK